MNMKPAAPVHHGGEPDPLSSLDPFLEQITCFLGEGVFILDAGGCMRFLNAEGERILGWTSQALCNGVAHAKIHHQNSAEAGGSLESCPINKCIRDGQVYHVSEDVFIHRDGRLVSVSFVTSPLRENNQVIGNVTVFKELGGQQDVEREIKQAQDIAVETARLKAEFLANMSHELRTPINGVIGMTNFLLDSKLNKEQREWVATTSESAQALLTMVNDILDFARIEAGKLEIKSEDFRPSKVVEEVAGLLASQAQKKNINLTVTAASRMPTVLLGDPARIRQVLLILVGNAVKFTKKGSVTIRVSLERKSKTRVVVRFSVTDTGISIPKVAQHRLFQPFTQVDGSSTRPYGGAGLGLSIANRLVELMGGQIGYEDRKGKGSLFWFAIPLMRSSNAPELESQSKWTSNSLQGVKVLIVDPQQTSQTVLLNLLLRWNMKGTSVESAEEVMQYLRHEASTGTPCRLVLVSSPPGDSREQAEKDFAVVRTIVRDVDLPAVNMVLLTGNHDKRYVEEARQAGYAAVVNKPLRSEQLLESLVSLLGTTPGGHFSRTEPVKEITTASHATVVRDVKGDAAMPMTTARSENEYRVLLAEDNAVIQKVTQIQLHRLGYTVHTVANGKEALEFMQTNVCSLVLMDCHMPVMDGYQAAQSIRNLPAGPVRVPIVGMLARTVKGGDLERCLDVGMNDVLIKPVQMDNLKVVLQRWLGR